MASSNWDNLRERLARFPRVELAHLPTPLEPLNRLADHLGGPRLWVKRDDCTGLAMGGNKSRKLEFALGAALDRGADTIISAGPLQSNHVRQTAAACARLGLACELVLSTHSDWDEPGFRQTANRLLVDLLGATVHYVETEHDRPARMEKIAAEVRDRGGNPWLVPAGASSAEGGLGYALCALEILEQAATAGITVDRIVLSAGSGGTQGGLVAGLVALGSRIPVIGIDIDALPDIVHGNTLRCARDTGRLLDVDLPEAAVTVVPGYAGEAYGLPTQGMIEALRLVAQLEGLLLDPVYTGKTMAGLIDHIHTAQVDKDETVVFVHTGGLPTLFAYETVLGRR